MKEPPRTVPETVSLAVQRRVDEVSQRFEAVWKASPRPQIEHHLGDTPEPERSLLLRELLAIELAYRCRRGEQPTLEEYRMRFANNEDLIRDVYRRMASPEPPSGEAEGLPETESSRMQSDIVPPSAGAVDSIGKYRIVEKLGQGGQANVFRAVHPQLPGRDVVIKWAKEQPSDSLQCQLLEEGRVLARLQDPGLVRVYDVDIHEGRPFLVLEHVAGRTLRDRAKEKRPSTREAAALVAQIARTLTRVHGQGVLHRDLKPANILLDATGRPRILDFGLALMDPPGEEARPPGGQVCGTYSYMAPEQAEGQTDRVGPRTDVFGLGAVLYELLTGRPPYKDDNQWQTWEQARRAEVVPPRRLNPRIPRPLDRICLKALAANPEQRYASAAELERALRGYLRRPRLIAAGLGLALLLGAAVLAAAFDLQSRWPFTSGPSAVEGTRPVEAVKILAFDVHTFRASIPLGDVGVAVHETHLNNDVRIHVQFSTPAYSYVIAFNPDGREQLCYPEDQAHAPAPVEELVYPARSTAGFGLTDGVGMQAFVLLVSRKPLPSYPQWREELGPAPWEAAPVGAVWRFNGLEFVGTRRGKVHELDGLPGPLVKLCDFFKSRPGIHALHVVAFPVKP
jgi:serine/threonine protein kinase